jgi:hypothetical protein
MSALSPLPLAAFGSPDTTQMGINFIRNYLSVCLEVTVIAAALVIFNSLVTSGTWVFPSWEGGYSGANAEYWNVMVNYIFTTVLQTVMLVITVMSASRIIKEILGT